MRNQHRLHALSAVLGAGLILSCGEPTSPPLDEGTVAPVITFVRDTYDRPTFVGPLTITARVTGPTMVNVPLTFSGTGGGFSGVWSGTATKLKPGAYGISIEAVAENELQYFGSNSGFSVSAGVRATPAVEIASVVPALPPPLADTTVGLRQLWEFPVVVGAQSYTLQASKVNTFPTAATVELISSLPQLTISLNDAGTWFLRARATIVGTSRLAAWSATRQVVVTSSGGRTSGTATPTAIVPGTISTVTNRNIVPGAPESWHQISARAGDTIYITTNATRQTPASGLNTLLAVYRANAATELANSDDASGLQTDSRVIAVAPATEIYYAKVSAVGGTIGQYTMDVELRRLPATPTTLTATALSPTSVALTWLDNATVLNGDNESGYELRRCVGPGCAPSTIVTTTAANAVGFNDTGLTTGEEYLYSLRAIRTISPLNTGVSATVGPRTVRLVPPTPPDLLAATTVSASGINLQWRDNDSTETSYEVQRCTAASCSNFTRLDSLAANATSYQHTGLASNESFTYRVRAVNAVGGSNYSATATATTIVPDPPSGLSATTISASQINLQWTDNATTETSYEVQRCVAASCSSFTRLDSLAANVTTYQNTGLASNESFTYRVRAINSAGGSAFSATATATTILPAAPSSLSATTISASQINLQWTDNSTTETSYEVQRCVAASCSSFTTLATLSANVTTYQNTGLAVNESFTYRVRAVNAAGGSAFTTTATANTSLLLARYELDGSGLDASGNGRNGTVFGAIATADRFGVSARAMRFNGTSAFISVPPDSGLSDASLSAVTLVAWFRTTQPNTGDHWIAAKGTDFQYNYALALLDGRPFATAWQSAGADHLAVVGPSTLTDGVWHQMVAVLRDNVDGKLFVDGTLVDTDLTPLGAWSKGGAGPLILGARNNGSVPSSFFDGDLDDVRIIRRALSDAEAIALYTGSAPFPPGAPASLTVTSVSTPRVDLAWIDRSANESGFGIDRCTGIGCTSFVQIATVGSNVSSYQDLSVVAATHYEYRVSAFNSAGVSAYSSVGTAVLRYSDSFSGTLANWVERDPENDGSWSISNGSLVGDYGISCGSPTCNHTLLLLADSLQPAGINWRMEVRSLRDTAQCCFNGGGMMSLGKFALWVADGEKEAFSIGFSWPGLSPPATFDSAYANLDRFPWANVGSGRMAVPTWSTALPQAVVLEKRGNTYRAFFNGVLLYTVTRTFSTAPKIGFETYGRVRMDDFRLYLIP